MTDLLDLHGKGSCSAYQKMEMHPCVSSLPGRLVSFNGNFDLKLGVILDL